MTSGATVNEKYFWYDLTYRPRYRLVRRGIKAVPLQPHWCALRPDACDMEPRPQEGSSVSDDQNVMDDGPRPSDEL